MTEKIQKIKIGKIINWSENPRHATGNNETIHCKSYLMRSVHSICVVVKLDPLHSQSKGFFDTTDNKT